MSVFALDSKQFRQFIIQILDDDNGISEESYDMLKNILESTEHQEILNYIRSSDGRYFLMRDCVKELKG